MDGHTRRVKYVGRAKRNHPIYMELFDYQVFCGDCFWRPKHVLLHGSKAHSPPLLVVRVPLLSYLKIRTYDVLLLFHMTAVLLLSRPGCVERRKQVSSLSLNTACSIMSTPLATLSLRAFDAFLLSMPSLRASPSAWTAYRAPVASLSLPNIGYSYA